MNTSEDAQFTSLNMTDIETNKISSGGLDFLPSNFDYETGKSNESYTKMSDSESVINFDNDSTSRVRHRGQVGSYLDNYGFGWLLEQNNAEIETEDSLPLLEELDIDLTGIKYKIKCVVMPLSKNENLNRSVLREEPDFWGPLFVVLLFALVSVYGQFSVVSWIITIWICGSFLVFVIARVLGGEVTYSQIIGIIGYSLLPLLFMGCFMPLIRSFNLLTTMVKMICLGWSTYSAATLLCSHELQHKKPLLLYPIFLLYIYFISLYSGV